MIEVYILIAFSLWIIEGWNFFDAFSWGAIIINKYIKK